MPIVATLQQPRNLNHGHKSNYWRVDRAGLPVVCGFAKLQRNILQPSHTPREPNLPNFGKMLTVKEEKQFAGDCETYQVLHHPNEAH